MNPSHLRARGLRRLLLSRSVFSLSLLPLVVGAAGSAAAATAVLPTGGAVVTGTASIGAPSASTLSITQSSSKAIIDWSSFSIGAGKTVQINNGSGATLNRVSGGSVSSLQGLLTATGSVYLINPNGVVIGKKGVVNVGGTFVASTLDVSNASFTAGGDLTFSGSSTAAVVNLGKVGALGGDVALIASSVSNAGVITAANSTAGLVAGHSVLMRDASLDDGRFAVLVGGSDTRVTNSGTIQAAYAELRAEGGNVYALAGDTTGVIRATGVKSGQGKVWLVAEGGTLEVGGVIEAVGAGGAAGQVETSGGTVKIGRTAIDAHGGTWLVDPTDLTIDQAAATSIDNSLNMGTSVVEKTTASGSSGFGTANAHGAGDIIVAAPLSWSSTATLTLDAYHSLLVNAPITVTGAGKAVLQYNDAGTDGGLQFGAGTSLNFTGAEGAGQALKVNGTPYALLYSMAELAGINGGSGADALAINLTAPTTAYTAAVVDSFSGTLEGLGHTITGLTINAPNSNNVGLIGTLQSGGLVRDLGLIGGSVTGARYSGGLVGGNYGTISQSYATGAANGTYGVGGLVGLNDGTVSQSYATGAVSGSGSVGGLVGSSYGGSINRSYATGNVNCVNSYVGGLVGFDAYGTISQSYATGAVSSSSEAGGLVGGSYYSAISQSYATGAASAYSAGGLAGFIYGGSISQSYATGAVSGLSYLSGLVGRNFHGAVTNSYYDTQTTGQTSDAGGATGLSTAQFMNPANLSGLTFTTTPGAAGFVIVDVDGTLNGSNGATRPILASEYSTTIVNAHQLQLMALNTAATYTLGSSVDASGTSNPSDVWGGTAAGGFVPLGTAGRPFTGTFNGNNAAIFDLTIDRPSLKDVGLFGVLGSSGQAINFSLNNPAISGQNDVGAVAGYSKGKVDDDIVYGGSVTAVEYGGGLVGYNAGSVSTSTATDNVSGTYRIGGLVGQNTATGAIFRVLSTGQTVTGVTDIGGLVGLNQGSVDGSNIAATDATVIATGDYAGGFIGYNTGSVTDGTSTGSVSGLNYVGGLIGYSQAGTISGGTSSASVTGARSYVGGLVGDLSGGEVSGSSASGQVQASGNNVGGLVGYNLATINTSSATGQVSGRAHVGGLVGLNDGSGVITAIAAGDAPQVVQGLTDVGGLVGDNLGQIGSAATPTTIVAANASVTATGNYAGALVGFNTGTISNATSEGSAKGAKDVGGIAGRNDGSVSNASTSADVTATTDVAGGLIGYNTGSVTSSTASGTVTATGKHQGPCYGVNTSKQASSCE